MLKPTSSSLLAGLLIAGVAAAESPLVIDGLVTSAVQVDAPARAEGPLVELLAKEGQLVKRGETVARVDSRQLALAVAAVENDLAKAKHEADNELPIRLAEKKLAQAEVELRRVTDKVSRVGGAISDSEIQRRRLARDTAQLELEHAQRMRQKAALDVRAEQNRLDQAQLAVEQCRVPGILDGKVIQVLKQPGEWVRPGDAVVRLARIDRMRVEALAPISEALVEPLEGRPAELVLALPGGPQRFRGKVTYVHNDVSSHKEHVRVWVEVENTGRRLRPGMKGQLTIDRRAAP